MATVGVIVGALAIMVWDSGARWIDPVVTGLIALYIFWHAGHGSRQVVAVLMEGAAAGLDWDGLVQTPTGRPDVEGVQDVQVWQVVKGRLALQARLTVRERDLGAVAKGKERQSGAEGAVGGRPRHALGDAHRPRPAPARPPRGRVTAAGRAAASHAAGAPAPRRNSPPLALGAHRPRHARPQRAPLDQDREQDDGVGRGQDGGLFK